MPSRRGTELEPQTTKQPNTATFTFPTNDHLVIITQRHVLNWDAKGISKVFLSASEGILAAKESKDGSGTLAIADSQVVVLHDRVDQATQRSYKLNGTEGPVRLLEYTNDSKQLFFSTTVQNAVQCYSISQSCLLDPLHSHPSSPTVLALSSNSSLLLSASENPPVIYLHNLTLRTPPVQLQPRASGSAVSTAAFHPDRPNVFMLGYRDGTLAAYDATRIPRAIGKTDVRTRLGRSAQYGEISHFKHLHSCSNQSGKDTTALLDDAVVSAYDSGTKSVGMGNIGTGITAARFLPGYKTRTVSVGSDGKCRMVDFDLGGKLLRTWHVRGPATSLSILSTARPGSTEPSKLSRGIRRIPTVSKSLLEESESTDYVIAVGRLDGKLLLFSLVGVLLREQVIDPAGGRVIDVEWRSGPSHGVIANIPLTAGQQVEIPVIQDGSKKRKRSSFGNQSCTFGEDVDPIKHERASSIVEITPMLISKGREQTLSDSGTIQHMDVLESIKSDLPTMSGNNYMDLFSPVKAQASPQRRSTRSNPRPRLSSSTFIANGSNSAPQSPTKEPLRNQTVLSPISPDRPLLTGEAQRTKSAAKEKNGSFDYLPSEPVPATVENGSPRAHKTRWISTQHMPGAFHHSYSTLTVGSGSSSESSKILADLRRLDDTGPKPRNGGSSILAPYMPASTGRKSKAVSIAPNSVSKKSEDVPDIWLDREEHSVGPPPRRTRTARTFPQQERKGPPPPSKLQQMKSGPLDSSKPQLSFSTDTLGYTASDENQTVEKSDDIENENSHLDPGFALSPKGPVVMKEFFPRSSSLSPKKAKEKRLQTALRELEANFAQSRRERMGTKGSEGEKMSGAIHRKLDKADCKYEGCQDRFEGLEDEVAELRREVAELRGLVGEMVMRTTDTRLRR